jgi:serine/threonine protein kinase
MAGEAALSSLWSCSLPLSGCGCVHVLASAPPFSSPPPPHTHARTLTHTTLENIVRRCEYPDDFYSVSSAAKELVRAMLCVDVAERITADQALECDWIQNFETKANSNHCAKTITNMRGFNARRRVRAPRLTHAFRLISLCGRRRLYGDRCETTNFSFYVCPF